MKISSMPIARRRRSAVMAVSAATMFLSLTPASAQSCLPNTLKGQTLASFAGGADGFPNSSGLVFRGGALYGATQSGGGHRLGSIYRLVPPVPPATNWTRSDVLWFRGAPDGGSPSSGLALDSFGSFYGVTYKGGGRDLGAVYKTAAPVPPATAWAKRLIYSFKGNTDGSRPIDDLVMGGAGALYGVLQGEKGAVFKLSPPIPPATAWTNTIIYRFLGGADGSGPRGPLLVRNGELYGVTHDLGDTGRGTVFRLTPPVAPATAWTKTIIHRFANVPGKFWSLPSSLVFDTAGSLYGAIQQGGALGFGAVFKLTRSIFPPWNYTILYSFKNAPDANNPFAGLTFDSAGALYGTTAWGGANGFGAVFRLTPPVPPSSDWTESVLYSFKGGPTDGATPISNLIFDTSGALYGVARNGGSGGQGTAFRLSR